MSEALPRTIDEADGQFLVGFALAATFVGAEKIEAHPITGVAWLIFAFLLYRMSIHLTNMKTAVATRLHDVANNPFYVFLSFILFLVLVAASNAVTPYLPGSFVSTPPLSPTPPAATEIPPSSKVEFIKNIGIARIAALYPIPVPPSISLHGLYASTGKHLRAFIEANLHGYSSGTTAPARIRVSLGEFNDFIKNDEAKLAIISSKIDNGQLNMWWGIDEQHTTHSIRGLWEARITIVDDDGKEQYYYIILIDGVTYIEGAGRVEFPNIISQEMLNFPNTWDSANARQ